MHVLENRYSGRPPLTLVTPFAGRTFCLEQYLQGLDRSGIDPEQTHVIWLDTSGHDWFTKGLLAHGQKFPSFTLLSGPSAHDHDSELTQAAAAPADPAGDAARAAAFLRLSQQVHACYAACFSQIEFRQSRLTWVIEDDVEVPAGSLATLSRSLEANPRLGTVIGRMLDRRQHAAGRETAGRETAGRGTDGREVVIAEDYEISLSIGAGETTHARLAPQRHPAGSSRPPTWGVQLIGTGHMGCWLTRSQLLETPGIALEEDGLFSVANTWGWRLLKQTGLRVAIDWSVGCKHWYLDRYGALACAQ